MGTSNNWRPLFRRSTRRLTGQKTCVYFTDGSTIRLLAVTDGSVIIGGETKTIKSITSPAASGSANSQTRVSNSNSVVLLVKTTDGAAALKQFASSP